MGTLWTPSGEQGPEGATEPGPGDAGPGDAELAAAREQLRRVREELSATPVRDIVANHAIGLWQLAVLHLGLDDPDSSEHEPDLAEAKLAVDAMASLVEGVIDRLGDHGEALSAALTNLRLAYVRVNQEQQEQGEHVPGGSPGEG